MLNRDIYSKNPAENVIANNGVVSVTDDQTEASLNTLRYELETFVCEGQYEKGLEKVLETFLRNLDKAEQPGIWISGFFGSGKSHLAKMLKALWIDFVFPADGARSRALTHLPAGIMELFKELSTQGKRYGGLHSASGTLGAGAGDNVRLALLGIVFKSVGLPEQYHVARFEMRLKEVGVLDAVKAYVENAGKIWAKERDHIYNSPLIVEAILKSYLQFAENSTQAKEQLRAQYTKVQDVTNDEMVSAIRDAISVDGRFPLTLIVLDEIQQYIANSADRAYRIQEVTETCCKKFGGKLLFVATGQTALSGTAMLSKLMGRFQVPIELSDTDVDSVIRKIILAKRAAVVPDIEQMMTQSLGEISRHLAGTRIEHRIDDNKLFVPDYPILPVRRRFWEKVLRMVDSTGTKSQLRSQLTIVHEATIANMDKPLGCTVPGDFIYGQLSSSLLQTGVLSKDIYEQIQALSGGTAEEQLKARLAGLIFLIGKLPNDPVADIGVRATNEMLSDLLVEDVTAGSADLRKKVPGLLRQLEESGLVMSIDGEYRLQTKESSLWHDEYRRQEAELSNNPIRVEQERVTLFRKAIADVVKEIRLVQGASKEARTTMTCFESALPKDADKKIYTWIRDGWQIDEKSAIAEARNAGTQSPTIFVYVPRHAADELNRTIITLMAAEATLEERGIPATPEAEDARSAMQTRYNTAKLHLKSLITETFDNIRVFQGGGSEIIESTFSEQLTKAATNSILRLYPQFDLADNQQWAKVFEHTKKGSGDALKAVGHNDDAAKHPVCSALLKFISGGKKGSEVRDVFGDPPYGWPQDAIDGALYAILNAGAIRAFDNIGKSVDAKNLERAKITQTTFKAETVTISAGQFIQVRKLLQDAGVSCKPGEELSAIRIFLDQLFRLASEAGGESPRPERPSVIHIQELKSLSGNSQILAVHEKRDELAKQAKEWMDKAQKIEARMIDWKTLETLLDYAKDLEIKQIKKEAEAISSNRLLIAEPNRIESLVDGTVQLLRKSLTFAHERYSESFKKLLGELEKDPSWQKISPDQQKDILSNLDIADIPVIATGSVDDIMESLESISLKTWYFRHESLPGLFEHARLKAVQLTEPKATPMKLPRRTLKTEDEAHQWLNEVETELMEKIKGGPVVI